MRGEAGVGSFVGFGIGGQDGGQGRRRRGRDELGMMSWRDADEGREVEGTGGELGGCIFLPLA